MRRTERCRALLPLIGLAAVTLWAPQAWAGDNTAPLAFGQDVLAVQNTPVDIVLDGEDPDEDPLQYEVRDDPVHGTLSGVAPNLRYTPNEDYAGPDSFTFVVNDGQVDSGLATVAITVEEDFNDPPQAQSQAVVAQVDNPVQITLTATDEEGDDLTFRVDTDPQHGSLSGQAPNLTYAPDQGYEGPDTFNFVANDGENDSAPATVFIDVGQVNGRPVALGQNLATPQATPLAVTLTGQDPESQDLTFRVTAQPEHGSLSGQAPNLTYTPEPDHFGADSFTFVVNDGIEDSLSATVSIQVGQNEAPVVADSSLETDVEAAVAVTLIGEDADGDDLEYQVTDAPENGTLTGDAPNLTYTPDDGFSGIDQFQFVATDGVAVSNVGTITVLVGVENLAPFGIARELTTPASTPLEITLEGADPEGRPLTFEIVVEPEHGAVSGNAPDVIYAPDQGYNGPDSFQFTVSDGENTSPPARVDIVVGVLNQVPDALDVEAETDINASVDLLLRGLDGDGDNLTYTVLTQPSNGTLSGQVPNLTYTPSQDFEGIDVFTYAVNDGQADSTAGVVTIQVGAPNLPPIAHPQTISTGMDTAVQVTLTGEDPEGRDITYAVAVEPFNGTLSGDGPIRIYTPADGFQGVDFFSFVVSDGVNESDAGLVRVRVGVPNEPPIADPQLVEVDEDSAVGITLTANDLDGDELTWAIVSEPSRGTLTGTPPTLLYTPPANFAGFDNFDFRVNDGEFDSNIATVVIEVVSVNDPPVTADSVVTTTEGVAVSFALTADDPDGQNLTFEVITLPQEGALDGQAPNLTYTPREGFTGEDSLVYVASDGESDSAETTVTIVVDPVNDAPEAEDVAGTTDEDLPLDLVLVGTDPDGDDLLYVITTPPEHGAVQGDGPGVTYVPEPEFSGGDSFRYIVTDGRLMSGEAEVTITVNEVNDPPEPVDSLTTTDVGVSVAVELFAFDPDTDELTYEVVAAPEHGELQGTAPNLTYVPDEGFAGEDSFQWTVNDGNTTSDPATATLRVYDENQENVAPTALAAALETDEDVGLDFTLGGDDFNGDPLTFNIVEFPGRGTLTGQAPMVQYTPNPDSHGPDFFTFTVSDGEFTSEPATVTITVAPVNDAPTVFPLLINTNQGRPVSFSVIGDDVDGDDLTYAIVSGPSGGTVDGDLPDLTYNPRDDFFGDDALVVRANDGQLNSAEATITLRVRRANNTPPVADDLDVTTDEDQGVDFELTGSDADDDLIAFIPLSLPANGNLSGNAPQMNYLPDPDFFGTDSFTFLVNDGTQSSATATVTFTVNPVNDAPVAVDGSAQTQQQVAVNIDLEATDVEDDDLTFGVSAAPENGSVTIDGAVATYTPDDGFVGSDSFAFEVSDGDLSDTATVTVQVFEGEPDAPVVQITTLEAWQMTPVRVEGTVADSGCDTPPTVTLVPPGDTLDVEAVDGGFRFTSDPLDEGAHTVTVTAESGCTGRTGRAVATVGADGTGPSVTVTGLEQDGVDPEDIGTWPGVDGAEPLRIDIAAADGRSGIAEVNVYAVDAQGDGTALLRETVLEVRSGMPPAGLATFTGGICDDGEACDGDRFDAGAFGAPAIEITVEVLDTAGNRTERTLRMRVANLRDALTALRDTAFAHFTESAPALSYLDRAVAQLDRAVEQLDAGFPRNALVATMQALGDLQAARRFDNGAQFEAATREVVVLIRRAAEDAWRAASDERGPDAALDIAARFLARADAHLRADELGDALLHTSNAYLWIAIAVEETTLDTDEDVVPALRAALQSLSDYGASDGAAAGDIATLVDEIGPLADAFADLWLGESFALRDAVATTTALHQALAELTPLIRDGLWTRNWRHDLNQVAAAVYQRGLDLAAAQLGEDHVVVGAGLGYLDSGRALLEDGRADSFQGQVRALECVGAALAQLDSQEVTDIPGRCCRVFQTWADADVNLTVPGNCR